MAAKKYQIFISSTFSDLKDERQLAYKAILDLEHIPAGMEDFPAVDMEQFEYIKKVIDECDYYLLIVGARYGSTDKDGVSFTEREFDYARSVGKSIIAFVHSDVESLPIKHLDDDRSLGLKLEDFRRKIMTGRMVKLWANRDQLIAALMQGINKAITVYPAAGWIRGDTAASDELLQENLRLRNVVDALSELNQQLRKQMQPEIQNLAPLTDTFIIRYTYRAQSQMTRRPDTLVREWREILGIVGIVLSSPCSLAQFDDCIRTYIENANALHTDVLLNEFDVNTVVNQFRAFGIIKAETMTADNGIQMTFLSLTERGDSQVLMAMAVRAQG